MSVDLFSRSNALKLLHNKQVWFFGDSNTRSMYKDLVWLLEHGTLVPQARLKVKNELTHANDFRTSNSPLTNGRNYEETREYYNGGTAVTFTFLTRVFSDVLTHAFECKEGSPDVVVFNSCLWDLSRWGPKGAKDYRANVVYMMEYLKKQLPSNCLVVFTTTLPLSSQCRGGFLKREVDFLRYQLPWHVVEANNFLASMAKRYKYDVLDLHYYMRFLREEWTPDGIHWSPLGYRLITNLLLTHLALSFHAPLPRVYDLDERWLQRSQHQNQNNDGSSKKRKETEVAGSNEVKKLCLNTNKTCNNSGDAVATKRNSDSIETKQMNVVQTKNEMTTTNHNDNLLEIKQYGVDSIVQTKPITTTTTNQDDNRLSEKQIFPVVRNKVVDKEGLSQTNKQPELVVSKQLNEIAANYDNNNPVETNEVDSPDLLCGNQIYAVGVELKHQLNVDLQNNNVNLLETKELTVTKTVGNTEHIITNKDIVTTDEFIVTTEENTVTTRHLNVTPSKYNDLSRIKQICYDNGLNEAAEQPNCYKTPIKTDQRQGVNVAIKKATIVNEETNDFIADPCFSKDCFFIGTFSPQLKSLK